MKGIKYFFRDLRNFIKGSIDYEGVPQNKAYNRKKGRKRKGSEKELITEEMLKENNISINLVTGGTQKRVLLGGESNTVMWEDVNVKSLVRESELSESEKIEILAIKNKKGDSLFNESFVMIAKKIKWEWSKGNGRPTIVKNLKGVKGASDGNVGKCIAIFNKEREKKIRN